MGSPAAEREAAISAIAPWYDLDFGGLREDIDFYRELLRGGAAGGVLEMGAGPGRVALGLADSAEIAAIEDSPAMLAVGRGQMEAAGIRVVQADMRCVRVPELLGGSALVVFALSTFQHLLARADQLAALRTAAAHLAPGGCVVLDLTAPSPSDIDAAPQGLSLEWTRTDADGRIVTKQASQEIVFGRGEGVDAASPIAWITYIYDATDVAGRTERSVARFPLRAGVTAGEVAGLFHEAGLRATDWFGGYDLSPAGEGDRLIVVGERCA